jgi:hypothetical protein
MCPNGNSSEPIEAQVVRQELFDKQKKFLLRVNTGTEIARIITSTVTPAFRCYQA